MNPANDNYSFRRSPQWWAANLCSLPALVAWVWIIGRIGAMW